MGKQRSTFAKLQRDKAKKEKAADRIAARKQKKTGDIVVEEVEVSNDEVSAASIAAGKGEPSPDELLKLVEQLHVKKASGSISEEQFEEAKVELFARLNL